MATYEIKRATDSLGGRYISGPLTLDTARTAKDAFSRAARIHGWFDLTGTDIGWHRETGWINNEGDYLGLPGLEDLDRMSTEQIAELIAKSDSIKASR